MIFISFDNLPLLSVGISIAAIGILGFSVFFNNLKSITNRSFLFFAFAAIFWNTSNYLISKVSPPFLALWILRSNIFFAVWYCYALFQFFYVFPNEKLKLPKKYIFGVIPVVILSALLTLTPYAFSRIAGFFPDGRIAQVINGPGIFLFGIVVICLICGGIAILFRKMIHASGREVKQLRLVVIGTIITFSLHILFNFIFPAFFSNPNFIPLGAIFTFPLVGFTAYAIIKHGLLNLKVVTTGIFAFVLNIVTFVGIIFSSSLSEIIFRVSTFVLILIFSIFLIRGVLKEVEQREKVEELSRAKSEFMSIASHQLRTPLSVIKGYVSLLEENSFGVITEKQKEVLGKVFRTNEDMIAMVNDLLNVTRAEEGRLQYSFEKTDLCELIERAAKNLELPAKEKGLTLEYDLSSRPVFINADKDKLTQVISNLIDNATKYTEKGGIKITVVVDKVNDIVTVSVADTGLGIGQEEMKHLFESFTRGKAGKKSWNKGSGMGLYIARQFMQAHRGRIWPESAGEGQGSTFFVELPLL